MKISEMTIDPMSNLQIRPTDNGLKEKDLPGISQESVPLELDSNGVPVNWTPPKDGE